MTTLQLLSRSAAIAGVSMLLPFAAFAQTATVSTSVDANAQVSTSGNGTKIKADSDTAIQKRVASLQDLSTKVNAAKLVSSTEKASIQTTISGEISNLQALQVKIDADSTADLKTDAQSITKDFRIYLLVIPQGRIVAASDRTDAIVALMQQLAPKLQTRITTAQTAGTNVSAAQSAYTDMMAKISDAQTQSTASVSETASLMPDQGNTTIAASNTASLKDAAAKLRTAESDLKAARADITTILNAVKGTGSTTASVSTN